MTFNQWWRTQAKSFKTLSYEDYEIAMFKAICELAWNRGYSQALDNQLKLLRGTDGHDERT